MNGLHRPLFYVICVLLVLSSGCVSTEVGDAKYQNNGILVNVNSQRDAGYLHTGDNL